MRRVTVNRALLIRVLAPLALFVLVIALWHMAVADEWVSSLILPYPREVIEGFWTLVTGSTLWPNLRATTWETVAGFLLGSGLGILLAVASSLSTLVRQTIYPYVLALQVTPRIALAPMLVAWLGFGYTPKIVLAATICFFPVFLNALTGMAAPDRESQEMFRSLGASRIKTFLHLRLPAALPFTFAGLKTALTLALLGAVVGEFITGDSGLGLLLQQYSYQGEMGLALAVLVILTLIGFALFAVMSLLDFVLVFWSHESRMAARTRRRQKKDGKRTTERAERSLDTLKPMMARGQTQSKKETIR